MPEDYSGDFGPFDGRIWLNTSHQGAMPAAALEQARLAIAWKTAPYHLTSARFFEIPLRLRQALGRLINAPAEEIILGNSNSYGIHLLASGLPWRAGDEVLLVKGDFPSNILPWLLLEKRGVRIRFITPNEQGVEIDELRAAAGASSRLLCMSWVHSFTGRAIDLAAVGEFCRSRRILFVLNGSQALGTRPLNVADTPVDALTSVGYKWLCGPYGTGFCWMRPEVLESLACQQAYWLAMQTADDLAKDEDDIRLRTDLGARAFDVFGTANFFNFLPWAASVDYLFQQGIDRIASHNDSLISQLLEGLYPAGYEIISPRQGPCRSTLAVFSHRQRERNRHIYERLLEEGIHIALRKGNLRLSPHLYNTAADIDRVLTVLNALAV
jgi:cysteine desulfurase/selenocysteine lyase